MRRNTMVIFGSWLLLLSLAPQVRALNVIASIKPVHSLVAAVMEGVAIPYLIIRTHTSPHHYALKPSDAAALARAQWVFWMGAGLEKFLSGPIRSLASQARSIELLDTPGVQRLFYRELSTHGKNSSNTRKKSSHGDLDQDPHIWLDPDNARRMLAFISQVLAQSDPQNAATYRHNTRLVDQRLARLTREIDTLLAPVRDRPYIVYHDAYQYFEQRFGLNPAAAVSLNPELPAAAGRIQRIQKLIRSQHIRCVFTEPQFRPRLLRILLEIPGVHSAVLDPLGADLPPGPALYEHMMKNNARTLMDCLSG